MDENYNELLKTLLNHIQLDDPSLEDDYSQDETVELSPQQCDAITLIASGMKVKLVATTLGVTDKTIYQWLKETGFKEALKSLSRTYMKETLCRVAVLANKATDTLEDVLENGSERNKLIACQLILANIDKFYKYMSYS